MSLRKWTRADRVALADLIDAYEQTGRLLQDPIPYPLKSEVDNFNRQAGHEDGSGRTAKAIREHIKRARDSVGRGSISRSLRDSVKNFKTREEKEAYAQAAAMFEVPAGGELLFHAKRKRSPEDDDHAPPPHEEASGVNSADSSEVRALKRALMMQRRKVARLEQEKESVGLAVYKEIQESQSLARSSLTGDEMMCLSLMFFNRHVRFAEGGRALTLFNAGELRGFVGGEKADINGALASLGEPFYRRCREVLSWDGTVFVQLPAHFVSQTSRRALGPADLAPCVGQKRIVPVQPFEDKPDVPCVNVEIDASYICLGFRVASMCLAILESDPEFSGDIRAASFDSSRLKRVGWTTIIPQSLLVCDGLMPESPSL